MLAPIRSTQRLVSLSWRNSRSKQPRALTRSTKSLSIRQYSTTSFKPLSEGSFDDPKVFSNRSTAQLIFDYSILRSCSFTPLIAIGVATLNIMTKLNIVKPVHWVIEHTYFNHFAAGKNLPQSVRTAALLSRSGLGTILDYSVESADGNMDEVVDVLVEAIRVSGSESYMPFSCFKISGLVSHHLLMRLNDILEYGISHPEFEPAQELMGLVNSTNFPSFVEQMIQRASQTQKNRQEILPVPCMGGVPEPLTVSELQTMMLPFAKRLERLGEAAKTHNQSVLVDAEQSWFQEAIHFSARVLMTRYNKQKPLVYNTYQMYLKASTEKLDEDIAYARANKLKFGAKIVRGAYMSAEAEWAEEKGREYPVHPSKEATHKAYDDAIATMLDLAKSGEGAVVVASHNEQSMLLGSQGMAARGMQAADPGVHFGQLYGMCDHMSLALAQNGHNVVKYVPFGPVAEVMPYLLRRVAENKGFLASTHKEQGLMYAEIKSRLFGSSKSL